MWSNHAPSSCPRLSRASTSLLPSFSKQGVDGRDKPGHDSEEMLDITELGSSFDVRARPKDSVGKRFF
jgi:hypothetical protein